MPINNLNNNHLSEAKKNAIKAAVTNKDWDFHQESPELSSPDVEWDEFGNDKDSRLFYEGIMNRLAALELRVQNSKILHDYDNYQAALDDYAYTSYKAGANIPGFETKRNELKQFFLPRNKTKPPTEENL